MNIIIVTDYMDCFTNGTVITAKRFADGLRNRGHNVRIIAYGATEEGAISLNKRYCPLISNIAQKQDITFGKFDEMKIREAFQTADIVHLIMPVSLERKCKKLADSMGIPATAAFHVQPENISYAVHLGRYKKINDFLYRYLHFSYFKKFEYIHCPTQFIADQLKIHGYNEKLYVISNGYDPDFVPCRNSSNSPYFEIISVGRYSSEKNQQIIIRAIAKSKYRDKIHLTLCGKGPNENKLKKLSDKYLNNSVSFEFLPKEKLIKKLQSSDLYVHSALAEIESISCIEAIACGAVPLIADSKRSAATQFALDKRSLFCSDSADDLKEKIDYWIEHFSEHREMSVQYAEYAKKFSLDNSIKTIEKMFQQAIDDNLHMTKGCAVSCL